MKILENISLAEYTTFKIGGNARYFCIVTKPEQVREAVLFAKEKKLPFFVLGGGSNILVSDSGFGGLVIKMEIGGIESRELRGKSKDVRDNDLNSYLLTPNSYITIVSAGAGENWDNFVKWTLENGFNGLENLSAIPGTVGASPVQNIGAYGVEVGQFIQAVHAFDTKEMIEVSISGKDCNFSYRNSLFKQEKNRYIVLSVDFILKKDGVVNIEYRDIREYFDKKHQGGKSKELRDKNVDNLTSYILPLISPREVREAVIHIRSNKLPDLNLWGTAGSFFKNPIIAKEKYDELKKKYPDLPWFTQVAPTYVKIPLGWILDNVCHLKGVFRDNVGTYEKQALVIVTKPGSSAKEVFDFTKDIINQVKEKTGIVIEAEVEWVN